jgi:endonuclease YncB( thermonuclease family)
MQSFANAIKAILILILLIGIAAALLSRQSATLTGIATVHDGDTLSITGERIRLESIDAPEFDQICKDQAGKDWTCGRDAFRFLRRLAGDSLVTCRISGLDKYDRSLGTCLSGERDLAGAMVDAGLALGIDGYFAEQQRAKAGRRGIWRGNFERPAEWRKAKGRDKLSF